MARKPKSDWEKRLKQAEMVYKQMLQDYEDAPDAKEFFETQRAYIILQLAGEGGISTENQLRRAVEMDRGSRQGSVKVDPDQIQAPKGKTKTPKQDD